MDYEEVIRRQSAMHVDKDGMLKERAKAMRELLDERGQAISGRKCEPTIMRNDSRRRAGENSVCFRACDPMCSHRSNLQLAETGDYDLIPYLYAMVSRGHVFACLLCLLLL